MRAPTNVPKQIIIVAITMLILPKFVKYVLSVSGFQSVQVFPKSIPVLIAIITEKPNKTIVFGHWRAKELNERFAGKWEEIDGDIYVDKERKLIGLDTTTALSYKVGCIVIED